MINMKKEVSRRYILKVAVNLFYISYTKYPDYGGEIDLFDRNGYSGNEMLDLFCKAFLDFYYFHQIADLMKIINEILREKNDNTLFFELCCKKEIELINNGEAPLILYWKDYYTYKKYGFDFIIEKALEKTTELLQIKRQVSIENVKNTIKKIINNNKIIFNDLRKIILFGSLAKGTNTETSDIDLLLIFEKNNPILKQINNMFTNEFNKEINQFPDVTTMILGEKNRFLDWILLYGLEVYVNEE